ncbi:hypothetical protein HPB47_019525 [Ixodes persulcatus]|uniref:Uncharacterized protein n=1 Tax=Ixodes persulcatus TaxID=34615 RepID=A0AC60QLH1_IXOPE|nr:hypothetical protein HPB47_019525 [Ixodes persulcatus]
MRARGELNFALQLTSAEAIARGSLRLPGEQPRSQQLVAAVGFDSKPLRRPDGSDGTEPAEFGLRHRSSPKSAPPGQFFVGRARQQRKRNFLDSSESSGDCNPFESTTWRRRSCCDRRPAEPLLTEHVAWRRIDAATPGRGAELKAVTIGDRPSEQC